MHTVLIVDDAEDILELAQLSFELKGWKCHPASNGDQAVQLAASLAPDVILLDYDLGRETGLDVLARLRAQAKSAAIPVVFLTGADRPEERQRFLSNGAVGVVSKPFDPMELADQVSALIERPGQA
jgi:two-component system OmpR family response regulator